MHEKAEETFLIRRHEIELKVTLYPNRNVKVEPTNCKADNLRLYTSIARTQSSVAQAALYENKGAHPYTLLLSLFDSIGWDIKTTTEQ